MLKSIFRTKSLSDFDTSLTRERLIQGARLAIVDDEQPLLIEELRRIGFAVDHDKTGNDLTKYDNQIFDVVIVDFHGVGQHLGKGQGLDLIKHIRRVSPRTRIVAYTSRSLSATESEFFRLSHAVLPKDLGLGDSLSLVESEVHKALQKHHLFDALILKLALSDSPDRHRMQAALVKALKKRDVSQFKDHVTRVVGEAAAKTVEIIISKLFF